MKGAAALILVLLLSGCACDRAARKYDKARRLCPEQFALQTVTDTVTIEVHDTVWGVAAADTVVLHERDTVRIDEGALHVQVIRAGGDTVYVEGKCDTVYVDRVIAQEVTVDCPPPVPCKTPFPWIPWLLVACLVLVIILLIRRR